MLGVFIIEGMTISLRNLSISMDEDGEVKITGPDVFVSYDACIAWARIALSLREPALSSMEERRKIWRDQPSEDDKAKSLEKEFAATMQAVVAAVTCIDALYDQVAPHAPIGDATKESWRRKRTARHTQIAETLRAAFRINAQDMKNVRHLLRAMYTLRDASVHPSSTPQPPHPHPELPIVTDWRLTAFRGDVADMFICSALRILWDITRGTKYEKLRDYADQLKGKLERLLPNGKPDPHNATVNFFVPPKPSPVAVERRPSSKPVSP